MNKKIQQIFNRFELKYVVNFDQYSKIKKAIQPFMQHDQHSKVYEDKSYPIVNVYFDSPNMKFYFEKVDGEEERIKLRTRFYPENELLFFEIKQKHNNIVLKRRVQCDYKNTQENENFIDHFKKRVRIKNDLDIRIADEIAYLHIKHILQPKVRVLYKREAFESLYESNVRITFDKLLSASWRKKEYTNARTANYVIPPNKMILEVKFTEKMPIWIHRLIEKYNLQLQKVSKYCQAVDVVSPDM